MYIAPKTAVAAEAAAAANVCAIYRMYIARERRRTNEYEYMRCIEEATDVVMALASQVRHDPLDSPRVHPTNASDHVAQPYALTLLAIMARHVFLVITICSTLAPCMDYCRRLWSPAADHQENAFHFSVAIPRFRSPIAET